jgi:hypothetical protein
MLVVFRVTAHLVARDFKDLYLLKSAVVPPLCNLDMLHARIARNQKQIEPLLVGWLTFGPPDPDKVRAVGSDSDVFRASGIIQVPFACDRLKKTANLFISRPLRGWRRRGPNFPRSVLNDGCGITKKAIDCVFDVGIRVLK